MVMLSAAKDLFSLTPAILQEVTPPTKMALAASIHLPSRIHYP